MRMRQARIRAVIATCALLVGVGILLAVANGCSSGPPLEYWHTEKLDQEFTRDQAEEKVAAFEDYLELENRLFKQLDEEVYARTESGPSHIMERYSSGSAADPRGREPDWNRSFELPGRGAGGVLLLHGMSDSPYSLRALGLALNRNGYHVIGLRLPGHGTAPSGLKYIRWQDMAAAADLAMKRLYSELGDRSAGLHIIGYSTGASLALDITLRALAGDGLPEPASLVLISPAIRVHGAARLAGAKDSLSVVPGLGGLAWLTVMDEFDPYKYNSFATNAGTQVSRVTLDVDRRLRAFSQTPSAGRFPPVLVLKSVVDATVTTEAVVDNLLNRLPADRNELVLFDINRQSAIKSTLLVSDPGPLKQRLLQESGLPFAVTFVTNESLESNSVLARFKPPYSQAPSRSVPLGLAWPRGVVSLSHVALPFPPDDPLYGQSPPASVDEIYLGDLAFRGERGLLRIPEDWLLRMRYNPFYSYLEERVISWIGDSAD